MDPLPPQHGASTGGEQDAYTIEVIIWGLFAKFVDSPYYSKLELCGGVV